VALRVPSIVFMVLFAFSAGATPPEAPAVSSAAPEQIVESVRVDRVVVAPLNVTVRAPAELDGKGAPVFQALLSHFQERDRPVARLSEISAERLWLEAIRDLDLSDRSAALRAGHARFARELARHSEFDILVVPSLVLRPGRLSGWQARWDGVQHAVPNAATLMYTGLGDVVGPSQLEIGGLSGKVAAVSLHVTLLRSDGSEIFEGLGGLAVLQEAQRVGAWDGEVSFVTRSEPFSDTDAIREGIERAFDGPTLTATRMW
jgi:hypothetical protein